MRWLCIIALNHYLETMLIFQHLTLEIWVSNVLDRDLLSPTLLKSQAFNMRCLAKEEPFHQSPSFSYSFGLFLDSAHVLMWKIGVTNCPSQWLLIFRSAAVNSTFGIEFVWRPLMWVGPFNLFILHDGIWKIALSPDLWWLQAAPLLLFLHLRNFFIHSALSKI